MARISATQAQCHAISEWLRAKKDEILAATPRASRGDLLVLAVAALGFDISPSTFETQLKLAGITWGAGRGGGRINTSEIARSCAVFCKAVSERLNMPLPSKLQKFLEVEAERKKKYSR